MIIENLPFDKYEVEPCPLTQYILSRKQASTCWQVSTVKKFSAEYHARRSDVKYSVLFILRNSAEIYFFLSSPFTTVLLMYSPNFTFLIVSVNFRSLFQIATGVLNLVTLLDI